VEGLEEARWALLDFVDVVVHVFQPEARQYYLLENLWGDAPQLVIGEDYFENTVVAARHPNLPGILGSRRGEPELGTEKE
jgi:ribosome-associated protein